MWHKTATIIALGVLATIGSASVTTAADKATEVLVVNDDTQKVPMTGTVQVGNFPATQDVNVTGFTSQPDVRVINPAGEALPVTHTAAVFQRRYTGGLSGPDSCHTVEPPAGQRLVLRHLNTGIGSGAVQFMAPAHTPLAVFEGTTLNEEILLYALPGLELGTDDVVSICFQAASVSQFLTVTGNYEPIG